MLGTIDEKGSNNDFQLSFQILDKNFSFPSLQNLTSNSKYMNQPIEWGQWDVKQIFTLILLLSLIYRCELLEKKIS